MATKAEAEIYPDIAIPPGETLAEELEARAMSQKSLAQRMGRPYQVVNEIINGKKAITARTAFQLQDALGVSAKFWINLETDYQMTKEHIRRLETKAAS